MTERQLRSSEKKEDIQRVTATFEETPENTQSNCENVTFQKLTVTGNIRQHGPNREEIHADDMWLHHMFKQLIKPLFDRWRPHEITELDPCFRCGKWDHCHNVTVLGVDVTDVIK